MAQSNLASSIHSTTVSHFEDSVLLSMHQRGPDSADSEAFATALQREWRDVPLGKSISVTLVLSLIEIYGLWTS